MTEPPAEVTLTVDEVDRLIATQHPTLRGPLTLAAHGWDNDVYRLGDNLAVRLPRRAIAAGLIEKEQRWLPLLAGLLPVDVPVPVATGDPADGYPWRWSVLPWFPGRRGVDVPETLDAVAEQLADVLLALHVPAPADAPVNPVRGVPMSDGDARVRARLASRPPDWLRAWATGVEAPPWTGPAVWVHGDVHPGNLILEGGRIVALIDFGDLSSGDPACDLAAAWMMFTPAGRATFRRRLGDRYDRATWLRARGWAAAMASLMIDSTDPGFRRMAQHTIHELTRENNWTTPGRR